MYSVFVRCPFCLSSFFNPVIELVVIGHVAVGDSNTDFISVIVQKPAFAHLCHKLVKRKLLETSLVGEPPASDL